MQRQRFIVTLLWFAVNKPQENALPRQSTSVELLNSVRNDSKASALTRHNTVGCVCEYTEYSCELLEEMSQ